MWVPGARPYVGNAGAYGRVRARTGPYAYTSPTAKVAKKWQKGGESSKLTKSSGKTGVELGFVQLEGHLR